MAADSAAFAVGLAVAILIERIARPVSTQLLTEHLVLAAASVPGMALGAGITHLYLARANERASQETANVFGAIGIGVALMLVVAFAAGYDDLSRLWVVLFASTIGLSLAVERRAARGVFAELRRSRRMTRKIVIVGTDAHAIGMLHTYQRDPSLGYEVVGMVGDDNIGQRGGVEVLGRVHDLPRVLAEQGASGVVVSLASVDQDEVNSLTRRLTDAGYHVALSSSLRDIDVTRLRPQQLDGRTLIYVEPIIRGGWRALAKRVYDVAGAVIVLVASSPVWLPAIVAIKLDSRGPVFFRQARVGRDGTMFSMIKFRTMVRDAEALKAGLASQNEFDGPMFKIAKDPRITRVGRVLRKYSIDELPQLLSVITGTMSLVGPRPALPSEMEEWDLALRDRLRVLPGVTGLWQVTGRSASSFDHYKRMDLYYVDNWSLFHDVSICLRTVGVVLTGRGAT